MIDLMVALLLGVALGVKTVGRNLSEAGSRFIGWFLSFNALLLIAIVGARAGGVLRDEGGSFFVFEAALLFSVASVLASLAAGFLTVKLMGARK